MKIHPTRIVPDRRRFLHKLLHRSAASALAVALPLGLPLGLSTPALAQTASPSRPTKDRKIALVIGNGNYRQGALKNPVGDAKVVAESLRDIGFDVTLRTDATLSDMIEGMRQFSAKAADASVRLVFFAGHGLQSRGRNYLLPVDADIKGEDEVCRTQRRHRRADRPHRSLANRHQHRDP